MRNLPAVLFVVLAACGGGNSDTPTPVDSPPADTLPPDTQPPPPDSQVLDLACAANTVPPDDAPANVTAAGLANQLTVVNMAPSVVPLTDASVQVCIGDCQGENLLAATTSAADPCGATGCAFSVVVETESVPVDGYLRISKQGVKTSNIFPSEPIAADVMDVPAIAVTPSVLVGLSIVLGVTQSAANGMLIMRVGDCALTGVEGATPLITQKGVAVGDAPLDASLLDPALAGTFLVLNVPPGTTTVGATVNGTTFRAHDVLVNADETTATQVTPGFAAP